METDKTEPTAPHTPEVISLIHGPFAGDYDVATLRPLMNGGCLSIPVDAAYEITADKPFAFAVYESLGLPDGIRKHYGFRQFDKTDEQPFIVECVGGPLAGNRPFPQPALGLPPFVMIPLRSEPATGEGRARVFALYKNDAFVSGARTLTFAGEHRDTVTNPRIIFEMVGGPFDGITYDSDAEMYDRQGAFWAAGHYTVTHKAEIGKRFLQMSPHFMGALRQFGDETVTKYGGPFAVHVYEVTEKLEYPYEVYVRAKFVGIRKEESE